MEVYNIKPEKEAKAVVKDEGFKIEALKEISRNPAIRQYFHSLVLGYNKSIIDDSRPSVLKDNHDRLVQWHAKKDQLERLLEAAKDVQSDNETDLPI